MGSTLEHGPSELHKANDALFLDCWRDRTILECRVGHGDSDAGFEATYVERATQSNRVTLRAVRHGESHILRRRVDHRKQFRRVRCGHHAHPDAFSRPPYTGITRVGIYRFNAVWALDMNGNLAWDASDTWGSFGLGGDRPITGDWNGSGRTKIGIYRPSAEVWALDIDGNLNWSAADTWGSFGFFGDFPVVGDWTGAGTSRVGIYRPSTALWALDADGSLNWSGPDTFGTLSIAPVDATPVVAPWP